MSFSHLALAGTAAQPLRLGRTVYNTPAAASYRTHVHRLYSSCGRTTARTKNYDATSTAVSLASPNHCSSLFSLRNSLFNKNIKHLHKNYRTVTTLSCTTLFDKSTSFIPFFTVWWLRMDAWPNSDSDTDRPWANMIMHITLLVVFFFVWAYFPTGCASTPSAHF